MLPIDTAISPCCLHGLILSHTNEIVTYVIIHLLSGHFFAEATCYAEHTFFDEAYSFRYREYILHTPIASYESAIGSLHLIMDNAYIVPSEIKTSLIRVTNRVLSTNSNISCCIYLENPGSSSNDIITSADC